MIKIIGLTGLTGSGKSIAAGVFRGKGAYVIDADEISREIMRKGLPAYYDTLYFFGDSIIGEDGEIVRKRLGEIVFPNPGKLHTLNSITHKYILASAYEKINEIIKSPVNFRAVLLDAPQLFESDSDELCDIIIVVAADEEIRLNRIMERDGITREVALARMNSQLSQSLLCERADYILENNGTIAEFIIKTEELADNVLNG